MYLKYSNTCVVTHRDMFLLRRCISNSAYIGSERTITGAMDLRRVNRLDRACTVFYCQLSDISVAVRH